MNNKNLHEAKRAKNDEFYTLLADIEKEMQYYDFQGKVVYCNCDDYRKSNFVKFFKDNFVKLGLDKLISTAYNEEGGIAQIYKDGWAETIHLFGDGSYNSDECIEYLKQADIVVTNPPFSKFRDYFSTLVKYDKKFIIVGNKNGISYKEVFPYIKNKKLWMGETIPNLFIFENEISNKLNGLCRWFTNIKYNKQVPQLILSKSYNEKDYPKYDNYDAINVDRLKDIPIDYDGYMGVPITAIQYLNDEGYLEFSEEKFEVDGLSASAKYRKDMVGIDFKGDKEGKCLVDGKRKYSRLIIKKKFEVEDMSTMSGVSANYWTMIDGKPKYARIFIKKNYEIEGIDRYIENNPEYGKRFKIDNKEKYARIIIKKKV